MKKIRKDRLVVVYNRTNKEKFPDTQIEIIECETLPPLPAQSTPIISLEQYRYEPLPSDEKEYKKSSDVTEEDALESLRYKPLEDTKKRSNK